MKDQFLRENSINFTYDGFILDLDPDGTGKSNYMSHTVNVNV
jgi:hypothetical protein